MADVHDQQDLDGRLDGGQVHHDHAAQAGRAVHHGGLVQLHGNAGDTILGSPETGLTERGKSVIRQTPAGRFGNPEDLLGTIDWLLDDRLSAYVTGQTVAIDGGFQAHAGV